MERYGSGTSHFRPVATKIIGDVQEWPPNIRLSRREPVKNGFLVFL
jgi:hypothetical protein